VEKKIYDIIIYAVATHAMSAAIFVVVGFFFTVIYFSYCFPRLCVCVCVCVIHFNVFLMGKDNWFVIRHLYILILYILLFFHYHFFLHWNSDLFPHTPLYVHFVNGGASRISSSYIGRQRHASYIFTAAVNKEIHCLHYENAYLPAL